MNDIGIPEEFVCPLTLELMEHPVVNIYGFSFESQAIVAWLAGGNFTCPMTRQPMGPRDVVPHSLLERKIQVWKIEHEILELPCPVEKKSCDPPLPASVFFFDETASSKLERCLVRSQLPDAQHAATIGRRKLLSRIFHRRR